MRSLDRRTLDPDRICAITHVGIIMASRTKRTLHGVDDVFRPDQAKKKTTRAPFDFVLDELSALGPETKPMFGCIGVYVGDRIVLILREKRDITRADDGVWLATTVEWHASLRVDFPRMRSIGVLGAGVTGWQVLPSDAPDFEESVLKACALIRGGDPRIGKVPASRRAKGPKAAGAGGKTGPAVKAGAAAKKASRPARGEKKTAR
jgi:hypothetical protein